MRRVEGRGGLGEVEKELLILDRKDLEDINYREPFSAFHLLSHNMWQIEHYSGMDISHYWLMVTPSILLTATQFPHIVLPQQSNRLSSAFGFSVFSSY